MKRAGILRKWQESLSRKIQTAGTLLQKAEKALEAVARTA
jgi:hypothetical protein